MIVSALYPQMRAWVTRGDKVLMHTDEINDRLQGVLGGYLLYAGLMKTGPEAISVIEVLFQRQLGTVGREVVAAAASL